MDGLERRSPVKKLIWRFSIGCKGGGMCWFCVDAAIRVMVVAKGLGPLIKHSGGE